jgi:ATP-dependent Clp protease ATP-binding subunit ClpA
MSIQSRIEDLLSKMLLEGNIEKNKSYVCTAENGEIKVQQAS